MDHFRPLEVVDRGSETQFQVVENLNYITWRVKGYPSSVRDAQMHVISHMAFFLNCIKTE